jgi:hypothetical protein
VTLVLHKRNAVAAMVVMYPNEYWFTLASEEDILFSVDGDSAL